ncbi:MULTISPECIES: carboxynorspermidine decarboxylase [environmental samples]|uniref:carboxynorspermidine decarboxylase n=1 Tax=environmental samples TaxID=134245 RepID=UPI00033CBBC6|nr:MULTISPECIES: carboxynorspermidine decarboxylase [environmental samples]CCY10239.1 carboxynorspermidine decarboxylase [Porphyromonas sp. CAG:1061]
MGRQFDFRSKAMVGSDPHQYFPQQLSTPAYVQVEAQLRANLERIQQVAERAGVEIILAFKAYALWKLFPIFREYISASTASSLAEARMGRDKMGSLTHTYAPVYKSEEFEEIMECSTHIVFNSLSQFERYYPRVQGYQGHPIECGIRINPEYSEVGTELYNPAAPGSRMGTIVSQIPEKLPRGLVGIHIHTHCESNSYQLERSLKVIEEKCDHLLKQAKWLNLGGGHLMTHQEYDVEHLIGLLLSFKAKYPHLHIILEPGSAFAWETGYLVATIEDIVENHGIRTLMMDASFTCHMPDCLEMPYQPRVRGAEMAPTATHTHQYRIGGNSCLSGDVMGDWYFANEPKVGDLLIFEDMLHYTSVKTTMFNGIKHPSICVERLDGQLEVLREYGVEDYLSRMD